MNVCGWQGHERKTKSQPKKKLRLSVGFETEVLKHMAAALLSNWVTLPFEL